jgi:hypothetical protein
VRGYCSPKQFRRGARSADQLTVREILMKHSFSWENSDNPEVPNATIFYFHFNFLKIGCLRQIIPSVTVTDFNLIPFGPTSWPIKGATQA